MKTINRLNSRLRKAGPKAAPEALKLDFGCGKNKREGFKGVDRLNLPGVDFQMDVVERGMSGIFIHWPWPDNSVEEAHASHFIEHLTPAERCHFFNELYRVLKPGAKCTVITPYWASARAYGDPTHQWPPIGEWFWFYLDKGWRDAQAPHTDSEHNPHGYSCNFQHALVTGSYSLDQMVATRNPEYQQHAVRFWKEAAQDMVTTITKPAKAEGNGG